MSKFFFLFWQVLKLFLRKRLEVILDDHFTLLEIPVGVHALACQITFADDDIIHKLQIFGQKTFQGF